MPNAVVTDAGLQRQLLDIFLFLGSEWILYLLMFLSIFSVAITFERLIHFARRQVDGEALATLLADYLAKKDLDGARAYLQQSRTHVAQVLLKGLAVLGRGAGAVEETVAGATQLERLKMERGLAFLGTLGNNAPFIGLFGTVLGIIRAFRDLATNTIAGSSAVMSGIAEALIATAVGLLVALPAVAVFNGFQRAIRTQVATADAVARVLLAHAKSDES
ncbi:MAG: MotA/TolQ/ExbB proton channel family protein [Deltaproteobacteria bacterium]|nr:MotA/TolQ/ExbB proton channel family protein [Deltaproteobacteria bacterium]